MDVGGRTRTVQREISVELTDSGEQRGSNTPATVMEPAATIFTFYSAVLYLYPMVVAVVVWSS